MADKDEMDDNRKKMLWSELKKLLTKPKVT